MNFATILQRQRPALIFMEALTVILVIGGIDIATGYEISLFIFYGVPIYAVAWFMGKKWGLLIALISGIVWWWASLAGGHTYPNNWVEAWETFVRIGFFLSVSIGASSLKREHDASVTRIALLEHSYRLETQIIDISEREQRRIGRDLHDGLCQHQAALACTAARLKGDLVGKGMLEEAKVAGELATLLRAAIGQTRDLARGLVPVQMEEAGLAAALEELARSVSQMFAIDCNFETVGRPMVFDQVAGTHLYRIAQEAINNATRHGRAKRISLSLSGENGLTILSIKDDGVGFSRTCPSAEGMGLHIMKYRAKLAGGQVSIREPADGGTTVSCEIESPREDVHQKAA